MNPNKNLLDLPEAILQRILDCLCLADLKNLSRVCSTFHNLSKLPIVKVSKICLGEPQTKSQLLKISSFQRPYTTFSIDELQHANGILNQLKSLKLPLIHLEIDINSDDRVYLTSTLKTISEKFQEMLLSISLNFQFEMDDILFQELMDADVCSSVKRFVYEKKYPKQLPKSLTTFKNLTHLSLDCSEELPFLTDVRIGKLKDLTISGVFSLESIVKHAVGLESFKIASQLSQVETIEKIMENNKQTLRKLNLCIANFQLNEPTRILKLVKPLENLEELSMRTALITKGLAKWMESNRFLKKLVLHCCDFDNEVEVSLDFFTKLSDLSWIALNDASQEHFYKCLIYCPSLESMTLFSFVKIDVKLEEVADLPELHYLFVDNEGFGSLVQNMRAPQLKHFVLHCKATNVDLGEVSRNVELLAENSHQIEKFNFDATRFQYLKEDFLKMLDIIFKKLEHLKDFSIKMEFDENLADFCEKIQKAEGLETAVIRTWTSSLEDKEILGQKFTDKIRIEFDLIDNKVEFFFQ